MEPAPQPVDEPERVPRLPETGTLDTLPEKAFGTPRYILLARCLPRDPTARFATVNELRGALVAL